jgi:hypothetical protein
MDLKLRKPKLGYKHEPKMRIQLSNDEWLVVIWEKDGFVTTAYEDIAGCRYLTRKARIQYKEDGTRYFYRDKMIFDLPDTI